MHAPNVSSGAERLPNDGPVVQYDDPYWVNGQALDDNPDDDDVAENHARHIAEAEAAKKAKEAEQAAARKREFKDALKIAALVLIAIFCLYICVRKRGRRHPGAHENRQPLLK